ncbi:PIN-like domain-containing protein [Duffyella gerundensis]|uniref:PIN-like domain-containing protein n=1 Tax=Duffyella gerundensis TaxID=1619313 RepID=UPI001654A1DE|nr:PIN-like domain-containing protein [Duffyella gerundensis]
MKSLFSGFYGVDDSDAKNLWNDDKTVFIFDTNALLLLYRCEKETRDAFFSQWEKIKERVWLPYHVCLEYQRNRLTAIKEHVMELENAGNHLTNKAQVALTLESLDKKHSSTIRRYESLRGQLEKLNVELKSTVDKFVKEQISTRIDDAALLQS